MTTVGAKMVTMRKYADMYAELFPKSTQVVVLSDPLSVFKSESAQVCLVCLRAEFLRVVGSMGADVTAAHPHRNAPCSPLWTRSQRCCTVTRA